MTMLDEVKRAVPACLGAVMAVGASAADGVRPNVIFIMTDDVGYADLSCYGMGGELTPNIDALARRGTRFTDAHSAAATSTPSRYSLLTGSYAWRRPDTGVARGDAGMIVRPGTFTLASLFRSAGYATAAIGKWHLGIGHSTGTQDWNGLISPSPADIGFDYTYIMAATGDRVPCVYIEQGRVANHDASAPIFVRYDGNFEGEPTGRDNPELLTKLRPSHGHDQAVVNGISRIGYMKGGGRALWQDETIADSILHRAVRFIDEHRAEPFFMYLCTNDIHVPRYPSDRFRGKSRFGLRGDAVLQLDHTIGALVARLDSLGLTDNTLIVFTSDNGGVLDDGYADRAVELAAGFNPAAPHLGGKYSSYEGGTAVPFIVVWPGRVKAGAVSAAPVLQTDAVASFARLLGLTLPEGASPDGIDASAAWFGGSRKGREEFVTESLGQTLSLRRGKWKYIAPGRSPAVAWQTGIATGISPAPHLYRIDKGESTDLAPQKPRKLKQMQSRLEEIKKEK